jgi:sugar/nucleoside kinase (ribokinase family)
MITRLVNLPFRCIHCGPSGRHDAETAARRANIVAALSVTGRGPAASPTAEETDRFLTGS